MFFALVHVLDDFCVDDVFAKPWFGVITSSLCSLIVFTVIPFFEPFVDSQPINSWILLQAFLAGVLIQVSQFFYFQSLSYSEAGIVAAYWNFVPAIMPFANFLLIGDVLHFSQYVGLIILIFCSIALCLLDANLKTRWKTLLVMLLASILQVIAIIIEKKIFAQVSFAAGYMFITLGIVIAGILPLTLYKIRSEFLKSSNILIAMAKLFIMIEIVNLVALLFSQLAVSQGNPSLVVAIETMMPAHAFIFSFIASIIVYKGKILPLYFPQKILFSLCMIIGVYLISL